MTCGGGPAAAARPTSTPATAARPDCCALRPRPQAPSPPMLRMISLRMRVAGDLTQGFGLGGRQLSGHAAIRPARPLLMISYTHGQRIACFNLFGVFIAAIACDRLPRAKDRWAKRRVSIGMGRDMASNTARFLTRMSLGRERASVRSGTPRAALRFALPDNCSAPSMPPPRRALSVNSRGGHAWQSMARHASICAAKETGNWRVLVKVMWARRPTRWCDLRPAAPHLAVPASPRLASPRLSAQLHSSTGAAWPAGGGAGVH